MLKTVWSIFDWIDLVLTINNNYSLIVLLFWAFALLLWFAYLAFLLWTFLTLTSFQISLDLCQLRFSVL